MAHEDCAPLLATSNRSRDIESQCTIEQAFLEQFASGDVDSANASLELHPELAEVDGVHASRLLRAFVDSNHGHCYKAAHRQIADMLIPERVRHFRDAVLEDQVKSAEEMLESTPELVHAEFTAGRGISQAIHHWSSTEMADVLIGHGADLEVLTTRGESPLMMQMRFGTVPGVRYLLEKGADPNRGDGGYMASSHMPEMVDLLLQFGWDINRGQLLHDANHGFGARVIFWLEHGADPNSVDGNGQTALHLLAARGTCRDAIVALVQNGADMNAVNVSGETPLEIAQGAKSQAAFRVLSELAAEKS